MSEIKNYYYYYYYMAPLMCTDWQGKVKRLRNKQQHGSRESHNPMSTHIILYHATSSYLTEV